MCGASSQQNQIFAQQQEFFSELMSQDRTNYAEQQQILAALTSQYEPILAAGPNQEGWSPAEKSAMETQIKQGTSNNFQNALKSVNQNIAASGVGANGSEEFLPSGAADALKAGIGAMAAGSESAQETYATMQDYAQGRQNFLEASNILGGVSGQLNPVGYGEIANTAGADAASTANAIAQMNNSWMGAVGGILGGGLQGWAQGGFKMPQ